MNSTCAFVPLLSLSLLTVARAAPALGADNSKYWQYNAHDTGEAIIKGAHRCAAIGARRWIKM